MSGKISYGLMKPRMNLLARVCLLQKQHWTSPKEHHSEAWWWQHHALGLVFFSWGWGLSQGGGNYEQSQIPVNVGTKPTLKPEEDWPSQSSDLNPTENLWGDLKRAVHGRCPRNLTYLECFCKEEWANIASQCCNKIKRCFNQVLVYCTYKLTSAVFLSTNLFGTS